MPFTKARWLILLRKRDGLNNTSSFSPLYNTALCLSGYLVKLLLPGNGYLSFYPIFPVDCPGGPLRPKSQKTGYPYHYYSLARAGGSTGLDAAERHECWFLEHECPVPFRVLGNTACGFTNLL